MTEKKTQRFESEVLGLPPLKMVLIHAKDEAQPVTNDPLLPEKSEGSTDKEQAVRRLIEHLNKKS
jgi:hypothetical protein